MVNPPIASWTRGATDPVAKGATVQMDPLTFEDLGLPVERQVVTKFRDDGEPLRRHWFKPNGERR
jgi:hypothetical protein